MDKPFTLKDRENFGRNVALVMALKEHESPARTGNALPREASTIRERLQVLSKEITSSHADLLELLVRFDEIEGWKCNGSKHCAAWMNSEIGICVKSSWEYLRVGRKLRTLSLLRAFFRIGKISWSKVRLISRVADESNESLLCHAALDASVADVKKLCEGYRWNDDVDTENTQAIQRWITRSLTWAETGNGNTKIQITLPPELAQVFLNSVEQSLDQTDITSASVSQRRADAAVLMAEKSLQSEGRNIATADRYQVVVSVDAAELQKSNAPAHASETLHKQKATRKRATVQNAGPIAKETARRIACDCSITVLHKENGEPINIGRKSRIWPAPIERAIKDRDQVCVWPGCTQSRHLHIHHIKHWADGGESSVNNGACLCQHHHTLVHEGGYTLINTFVDEQPIDTQFFQQLNTTDTTQFDFEKNLRKDWKSFNAVRKVMPSLYRFRILDPDGKDIGEPGLDNLNESTRGECREDAGEYCVMPAGCRYNGDKTNVFLQQLQQNAEETACEF